MTTFYEFVIVDIFPVISELTIGKTIQDVIPYKLDGINITGHEKRKYTYSEIWTCNSPVWDFDAKKQRFTGDFTVSSNFIRQRAVRTNGQKLVLLGKIEEFINEDIYEKEEKTFLKNLYKCLLYREADKEGFTHHLRRLEDGVINKRELYKEIINSDEYKNKNKILFFDLMNDPYEYHPVAFRDVIFKQNKFFIDTNINGKNSFLPEEDTLTFMLDKIFEIESMKVNTEKIFLK